MQDWNKREAWQIAWRASWFPVEALVVLGHCCLSAWYSICWPTTTPGFFGSAPKTKGMGVALALRPRRSPRPIRTISFEWLCVGQSFVSTSKLSLGIRERKKENNKNDVFEMRQGSHVFHSHDWSPHWCTSWRGACWPWGIIRTCSYSSVCLRTWFVLLGFNAIYHYYHYWKSVYLF